MVDVSGWQAGVGRGEGSEGSFQSLFVFVFIFTKYIIIFRRLVTPEKRIRWEDGQRGGVRVAAGERAFSALLVKSYVMFWWVGFSLPVAVQEAPEGFGVLSWPPLPSYFYLWGSRIGSFFIAR